MSEHDREFVRAWRAAEATMEPVGPSTALDARMAETLEGPRLPRWPLWTAAAVAGAAAVFLLATRAGPAPEPARDSTPIRFSSAACAPSAVSAELSLAADCGAELDRLGAELTALGAARLRHSERGVRVVSGRVRFEVARREATPFTVLVSGGRIEVLGTRFTVEERGDGGEVHLERGRIDFIGLDEARVALNPGAQVSWGAPAPWTTDRLDRAVAEVTRLRVDKRPEQAAERLRSILAARIDPGAAEVLSYELGLILQDDLQDAARGCAHWREHGSRFAQGRYRAEVVARTKRCRVGGNSEGRRE